MIKDWIVPMKMEESLLIDCLRTRAITTSFSRSTGPAPGILDKKIGRLLDKEGIACIPMFGYDEKIGVIVLGLERMEFSNLDRHFKLLQMLADQAAIAIRVHHHGRTQLQKSQSEQPSASAPMANNVVPEVKNPLGFIKNYLKSWKIKLA